MPFAEFAHHAVALERWLLPAECLLCQAPIVEREQDPLVCALCRSRWRRVPDPVCERCGQPAMPGLDCRICAGWPDAMGRVRSAVWLDGNARDAVHRLKYDGWWRVADAMAAAMRGLEPVRERSVLVPIPLSGSRQRRRGYNQAERIAGALGALRGLGSRAGLLTRVRETSTQTALTPEERQANVAGAFRAGAVRGLRLVLVDDVFTTGATLVAAATALMEAGATHVDAITFARANLPVG